MYVMKMKYVLQISAVFPPEPVVSAKLSMDLYRALKEKGYNVIVLHPSPTRPFGFTLDANSIGILGSNEITTDSFVCPESSLLGRIRESWSFGKACEKYITNHHNEIECIYANSWPMFSQRAIVRAAKKNNIPCIIHVQDVYPESLTNKMSGLLGKLVQSLILPMDKYILSNCNHVVAISEKMKSYLVETRCIKSDKISVVTNWQDETEFINYQSTKEKHPLTFMYMGNIGPVAGVELLIDAFIKANLKEARLVIAGSGSVKEQMVKKAEGCTSIEFWEVPNGKVPEIQSKSDVMMLPIKRGAASSSIPSKLPAYMFSSKPIIGCMDLDSDTANAIKEADCGWVIEPENTQLLAEMMRIVSTTETSVLKEKGEKAFRHSIDHFSKAANLPRLVSVIESVC